MGQTGNNAACQVKKGEKQTKKDLYAISKHPQKNHIGNNMQKTGMDKLAADKGKKSGDAFQMHLVWNKGVF